MYSHFQRYILRDTGVLLPMHKCMVNNKPFLFVCDCRTAEMANNEIKVAVTKPWDRGRSGLLKKAAESTRSHNHRHREPIGNGGFLSCVCSFSLHSGEWERSPCLWTRNAGQWKVCARCVWQCQTSHRYWLSLSHHGLSDVEITQGRYRPPWAFTAPAHVGKLYRIRKDPIWVSGAREKMAILYGPHIISASFADWENIAHKRSWSFCQKCWG